MSPAAPLTIGEELGRVAPGRSWVSLADWPPDVFAATATILADSGAYRCVICPPEGEVWPPPEESPEAPPWEVSVRKSGGEWAERTEWAPVVAEIEQPGVPESVERLCILLDDHGGMVLDTLAESPNWPITTAILSLHAMADEASVGVGLRTDTRFQRAAMEQLEANGSVSRLSPDRVRVLPKLRAPDSGITLRSVSHNLAFDRSEVHPSWLRATHCAGSEGSDPARLTMLLVPYPSGVHASDFHPVLRPLMNMDLSRFGFFEYSPVEPLEPSTVMDIVEAARPRVGAIDVVVLPESAVGEEAVPQLQKMLSDTGVSCLITGVHRPAGEGASFGANYAYIGGDGWHAVQHKHHRWCLDPSQIHQYHLGAALDPDLRWWEAISIGRRTLNFVAIPDSDDLTVCPLVCEDLARPDPVTDVIRAVAPTLVVALLLDGPQLAERWPGRYASVLADDPGCSVLTLTSLGMVWRSQPAGFDPSRVIALWKDPHRGLQQITLAEGARAVALTAHRRDVEVTSADGRSSATAVSELVLSGLEQIT